MNRTAEAPSLPHRFPQPLWVLGAPAPSDRGETLGVPQGRSNPPHETPKPASRYLRPRSHLTNLHASAAPGPQIRTSSTAGQMHPTGFGFSLGVKRQNTNSAAKTNDVITNPTAHAKKSHFRQGNICDGLSRRRSPDERRGGRQRSGGSQRQRSPALRKPPGSPASRCPHAPTPAPQPARAQSGPPEAEGGPQPPPPCPAPPYLSSEAEEEEAAAAGAPLGARGEETAPTGSGEYPRPGTARSPALALRPAPMPRRTAGGVPLLRGPLRRSLPRRSATLGAAFQQSAKRSLAASSPSSRLPAPPPRVRGAPCRPEAAPLGAGRRPVRPAAFRSAERRSRRYRRQGGHCGTTQRDSGA